MTLTNEDRARLRTLIENAMTEVDAAADPDATIQPDDGLSLMNAYDWGRNFLQRMDKQAPDAGVRELLIVAMRVADHFRDTDAPLGNAARAALANYDSGKP